MATNNDWRKAKCGECGYLCATSSYGICNKHFVQFTSSRKMKEVNNHPACEDFTPREREEAKEHE